MWYELRQIFSTYSHDPSVRAIVLSGAGPRAFTSGLDVLAASQSGALSTQNTHLDPSRFGTVLRRHILDFQSCVSALERCEKPVIAVMHGITFGLGIDLACCADVRICARDTQFSVREIDIGLAADVGTLSRLPKAVGSGSWVKDVCLTARVWGAEEALRVGFVSGVEEGKEAAVRAGVELAGVMAGKSPVAVQGTKELLNWSRDHTVEDGMFV